MATATPIPSPQREERAHAKPEPTHLPLGHWHLLSLDAPTVAALWTWFVASANHIHLPASSILAMAIAVWILYAADRLMDARLLETPSLREEGLEARHYFHYQHRIAFLTGILVASLALAILLPRLEPAALHLYLFLAGLLAGYFILIHAASRASSNKAWQRLPKEIAVGIFFASAIFIPTVARRPDLRFSLLPAALLFAAVCSLNCLFIYAWEHPSPNPTAHATTRFALRHLRFLTALVPVLAAAQVYLSKNHLALWTIPTASALSAILLLFLHHRRRNVAPVTLRAAADLALLTPLLFLPFF